MLIFAIMDAAETAAQAGHAARETAAEEEEEANAEGQHSAQGNHVQTYYTALVARLRSRTR